MSIENKTGGAAFPIPEYIEFARDEADMTLLDYFAAKAMQSEVSNTTAWDGIPIQPQHKAAIAERSYELAAAMLAERKKYITE